MATETVLLSSPDDDDEDIDIAKQVDDAEHAVAVVANGDGGARPRATFDSDAPNSKNGGLMVMVMRTPQSCMQSYVAL